MAQSLREYTSLCNIELQRSFFSQASGDSYTNEYFPFSVFVFSLHTAAEPAVHAAVKN